MNYIFSAVFTPDKDGEKIHACIPDLPGCVSSGDDLQDAIVQITDAAAIWMVMAEDENLPIPTPTPQTELAHEPDAIVSLIQIDTIAYRAATDTRT